MKSLLFLLCLFSITSCNLEDTDRYFFLNADLKAYFNYHKGSYWVYNDDLNATDTLVITSYTDEIGGENFDSHIDHKESIYITYSMNDSMSISDQLGTSNTGYSSITRTVNSEKPSNTYFRNDINIGCNSKSLNNGTNHSLLEDYSVNGVKFNHVLHYIDNKCINRYQNGTTDTVKVEYFIAKNIGVIERRYSSPTETQCWKLVSYHLE